MQRGADGGSTLVRSSFLKSIWQLFAAACVAAIGLFDFFAVGRTFLSIFLSLLGVAAVFTTAAKIVKPDVLEITGQGLVWKTAFRVREFKWSEMSFFRVRPKPLVTFGQSVVFDWNPGVAKRAGMVDLGQGWEIDDAALCSLLETARAERL